MWMEKMKRFFKGKTIEGNNLQSTDVSFDNLSSLFTEEELKEKETMEKFEKVMISMFERSADIVPEKMKIKDGRVVVDQGTLYHVCPLKMEALEGLSQGGLLCSEWFGVLESEGEGRFCSFVSTTSEKFDVKPNNAFVLYFDTNNPLMEKLAENDYFEYIKRKKVIKQGLFDSLSKEEKEIFIQKCREKYASERKGKAFWESYTEEQKEEKMKKFEKMFIHRYPEFLPQKLTDELRKRMKQTYEYDDLILDLFDQIIEPLSLGGLNFHDDEEKNTYYWKAIPGGIPSSLINGLQVNSKVVEKMSEQTIDQIQKLFPHATIFDENKRIVSRPLDKLR